MKNNFTSRALVTAALAAPLALSLIASTAFADTLTRQLQLGMTGADVGSLQTFLATDSTIYPQGLVTNYFGFLTKSAVSNFQTRNGIDSVGRVGPVTLAAINAQMGGVSSTAEGAGKVTHVGPTQPMIMNVSATSQSNGATVAWSTNVSSTAKVWYSTSYPFNMLTANSVTSNAGMSSTQSVTLSNLASNTTYYYVAESLDADGNFSWSQNGSSFKTQ